MKKENKKSFSKKFVDWILSFVFISFFFLFIWGCLYILHLDFIPDKDKNDKYEYKDGKVYFTEANYFFGSIFNKDTLVLSDDNIEIFSRSFFGEEKTVLPYSNLKEVVFSNSLLKILGATAEDAKYKIVIKYSGGFLVNNWATLYFNQKDTFDLLKILFKEHSKNHYVITESL
ncbi:MAG: hypothetical protein ABSG82_07600 [Sedimentisphaerales bacterium]|jgi:hypothetical protein